MRPARLPKGQGQVTITATLRRGGKVNDQTRLTFAVEDEKQAFARYLQHSKTILETPVRKEGYR